ncbi:MAG TPA: hypothetical protein VMF64_03250 [Steroidobacteraceae bacterium]|nr:hypothetical protein [Steroidobacteraceae bacterium]
MATVYRSKGKGSGAGTPIDLAKVDEKLRAAGFTSLSYTPEPPQFPDRGTAWAVYLVFEVTDKDQPTTLFPRPGFYFSSGLTPDRARGLFQARDAWSVGP